MPKKYMQVKIITPEEAIKLGLKKQCIPKQRGGGGTGFIYGVVGKGDKFVEVHKINIETKEKTIIHETKEYKKLKEKLKINEYSVDNQDKDKNLHKSFDNLYE